ncbi:hypothetical protein FUAX_54600 (plasmid) [Fulvitalea axinellae]|uniref:Uncharacterized protein n=1 Tax=Fulvitalea axinellae TaxID=1182444 RepID=A0AAU9DAS6_9BACT|nr:hypothetical protein FUAX_54600 [Fulvitalea axinellae]
MMLFFDFEIKDKDIKRLISSYLAISDHTVFNMAELFDRYYLSDYLLTYHCDSEYMIEQKMPLPENKQVVYEKQPYGAKGFFMALNLDIEHKTKDTIKLARYFAQNLNVSVVIDDNSMSCNTWHLIEPDGKLYAVSCDSDIWFSNHWDDEDGEPIAPCMNIETKKLIDTYPLSK